MNSTGKYIEPVPSFFDAMKREAQARCEKILENAHQEAARIVAEARQTAAENRSRTVEQERQRAQAQREDARQRAQAEAERANMTMRERVADRILDAVHEELRRVAQSPEFRGILCLLLAETIEEAPADPVVLAPPEHAAACREWLDAHGKGHIPVESEDRLWDGVAVTDAKRTVRLTNTLTRRFEKCRASARKAALRRLFGDAP